MHIRKRGRPRLDRPSKDEGTPELIIKRVHLSPANPAMSTRPLDVLLSRDMISQEAHAAATYWLALRKIIFGKATPGAVDLLRTNGPVPEEADDKKLREWEDAYRNACLALKRQGGRTFAVTEDILVHERWPEWIQIPRSTHWERRLLLLGIAALLGWYRGKERS